MNPTQLPALPSGTPTAPDGVESLEAASGRSSTEQLARADQSGQVAQEDAGPSSSLEDHRPGRTLNNRTKANDRELPEELRERWGCRTGQFRSQSICLDAHAPPEPRGTPDRELAGPIKLVQPAEALKQCDVRRVGCDPRPDSAQRQVSSETRATTSGEFIELIEHLVVAARNVELTGHLGEHGGLQALESPAWLTVVRSCGA